MQLLKHRTVWNSYLAAFKDVALNACEEVKFLLLVLCKDLEIVLKASVQCHRSCCCVVYPWDSLEKIKKILNQVYKMQGWD